MQTAHPYAEQPGKPRVSPQPATGPSRYPLPRIAANQLFQGGQEILIEHSGDTYLLRITRNGKLILTK